MPINALNSIGSVTGAAAAKSTPAVSGAAFKDMLFSEIEKVNEAQAESRAASAAAISGTADNLHEMKIAGMKAELTLEYAVSVNNKAIEAYKEIMRVQL